MHDPLPIEILNLYCSTHAQNTHKCDPLQALYDRIFFAKYEIANQMNLPMPLDLQEPCNIDGTSPISAAQCAKVSANEIT